MQWCGAARRLGARWASQPSSASAPQSLEARAERDASRSVELLLREGRFDSVVRVFDRMRLQERPVPESVRDCAVAALAELGAYGRCCEVYNGICESTTPSASVVCTVMKAAFVGGHPEDVLALFAQGDYFHPDDELIHKSLGAFLFDQRRFSELLQLHRRMVERGIHEDPQLLSLVARAAIASHAFDDLRALHGGLPEDVRAPIESHYLFSLTASHRYHELLYRLVSTAEAPSFLHLKLRLQACEKLELPFVRPEGASLPLEQFCRNERIEDLLPLATPLGDREFRERVASIAVMLASQLSPSSVSRLLLLALDVDDAALDRVLVRLQSHRSIWLGQELDAVFDRLSSRGRADRLHRLWDSVARWQPSFVNPNTVARLLGSWERSGRGAFVDHFARAFDGPERGSPLFSLSLGEILHARGDAKGAAACLSRAASSGFLGDVVPSRVVSLLSLSLSLEEGREDPDSLFRRLTEVYLSSYPFYRREVLDAVRSRPGPSSSWWGSLCQRFRAGVSLCDEDYSFHERGESESLRVET